MKKLLIILFIVYFTQPSHAQGVDSVPRKTKHALGMQFGTTTGVGFSYRYQPSKFGVQAALLPASFGDDFVLFAGLSGTYRFFESHDVNLFAYAGKSIIYNTWGTGSNHNYNTGFGAGLERRFAEVITVQLQLGYAIYDITNQRMLNSVGIRSGLAFEWGLHYHF